MNRKVLDNFETILFYEASLRRLLIIVLTALWAVGMIDVTVAFPAAVIIQYLGRCAQSAGCAAAFKAAYRLATGNAVAKEGLNRWTFPIPPQRKLGWDPRYWVWNALKYRFDNRYTGVYPARAGFIVRKGIENGKVVIVVYF